MTNEQKNKKKHKVDPAAGPAEGIVDTHESVARSFGVSVRTVRNWAADGMPVLRDGRYSIAEIQAWRFRRNNKVVADDKQGKNWDEEYRRLKALKEGVKYKKEIGELFEKADIEKGLIDLFTAVKTLFLSMPKAVSPQLQGLDARQIESILSIRIKEIITMISSEKIFSQNKSKYAKVRGQYKKT